MSNVSTADLCKGMFAGALAGVIGSFAMTRFHVALSGRGRVGSEEPQSNKPVDAEDDVAMETADLVAQSITGRPLTREEKTEVGGPLAHYAFGAAAGAFYGAMCEMRDDVSWTDGASFGTSVWVTADQLGLPLAGLTPWPLKAYPISTNLQHLISHLVYGYATTLSYRALRSVMGRERSRRQVDDGVLDFSPAV